MSLTKELAGVRAVICDVYGTLLHVGPPPENAEEMWQDGCRVLPEGTFPILEVQARYTKLVEEHNRRMRRKGEPYPDAHHFKTMVRALPGFGGLDAVAALDLTRLYARCLRTSTAMPGSVLALAALREAGVLLGLASNAQQYTFHELEHAGIDRGQFHDALQFISGNEGFAKPSPRVFARLSERLADFDIEPWETLMVGDSLENDIAPAAAAGWRTWHIGPRTWGELAANLRNSTEREVAVRRVQESG